MEERHLLMLQLLMDILRTCLCAASLRSPFSKVSDSFNTNYNDNIIIEGGGSWTTEYSIPTGKEQIGRKITVCCIGTGEASISSSNAKFYEYGRSYNELILNKEIVQLIGYGLGDTFYGWIVTCREDLDVTTPLGVLIRYWPEVTLT